ncbi:endonuclease/exonuclease/phosphatase family protein [Natronoglycomyces albus]|uniref:Endonuclease/exonuclease/phosphatase family protein n=1 Tax=Natronoglycomyces albus TaxID=2811108 RepID=A0A895XSN6_9ACTN|nr:endonuclease/exonuclease/phosphatase family protein [Natronoglycomyces albus]QSB04648.1 endonuclease/exonuclease/phosphatase family protein [Natronoglycomyces albus]
MSRLRIMTYNIHHGADPANRLHLAAVGFAIQQCQPDIICLQEVDRFWGPRSDYADQATELATQLGMHVRYGPSLDHDGRQYGNAILSPFDINKAHVDRLPTEDNQEPRTVLWAQVHTHCGPVTVATTHFSAGRRWRQIRARQAAALADLAQRWPEPIVVAGDFNSAYPSEELEALTAKLRWARHPRRTWRSLGSIIKRPFGATYPSAWPFLHLDRVLTSPQFGVRRLSVPSLLASDHRPLVVDLATTLGSAQGRQTKADGGSLSPIASSSLAKQCGASGPVGSKTR